RRRSSNSACWRAMRWARLSRGTALVDISGVRSQAKNKQRKDGLFFIVANGWEASSTSAAVLGNCPQAAFKEGSEQFAKVGDPPPDRDSRSLSVSVDGNE